MKNFLSLFMVFGLILSISVYAEETKTEDKSMEKSIYDFTMKDIDGKDIPLKDYKGKVVLIVNVASKCGFTPQYEQLESVYKKYQKKGLVILGFPANNFKEQEPGTNAEIKEFCTTKYSVTFPMFAKISVKGEDIHPLYQYLTSKEENPEFGGEITWNFNKFLIDRMGKIVARYPSNIKPDDPKVLTEIVDAIALDRM